MPPKPKKAVRTAKQITQVKKAIPKPRKAAAKKAAAKTTSKPIQGLKAPKGAMRPGPLGPRNGSGSIPFQGPGPQGQGVY